MDDRNSISARSRMNKFFPCVAAAIASTAIALTGCQAGGTESPPPTTSVSVSDAPVPPLPEWGTTTPSTPTTERPIDTASLDNSTNVTLSTNDTLPASVTRMMAGSSLGCSKGKQSVTVVLGQDSPNADWEALGYTEDGRLVVERSRVSFIVGAVVLGAHFGVPEDRMASVFIIEGANGEKVDRANFCFS